MVNLCIRFHCTVRLSTPLNIISHHLFSLSIFNYVCVGEFLAVGAPELSTEALNRGYVFVYGRSEGSDTFQFLKRWQSSHISQRDGRFGFSVVVNEDGNIAVGAPGERSGKGSVYVYKRIAGPNWTRDEILGEDVSISAQFGYGVAMDRNFLVVGAPQDGNSGSVFIYEKQTTDSWAFSEQLTSNDGGVSDYFGASLAMDNNNLVVGSPNAATSKDFVSSVVLSSCMLFG